uniref:Uncharacterized protein n=1 Tax=Setaria italica TaxID=4555 RepID=K3ZGE0_SETIT
MIALPSYTLAHTEQLRPYTRMEPIQSFAFYGYIITYYL